MATDEDVNDLMVATRKMPTIKKRVEFFASTVDAFLQDFLEKVESNDKLGCIVACARMAQLGGAMSQEFQSNCNALLDSDTEQKVGQQACSMVVDLVNKNAVQCGLLEWGVAQDAATDDHTSN